jgi:hypothetical protein
MRSFIIIVLLVAVAALTLSMHDASVSPAATVGPVTRPGPTAIAGARTVLLPDGKVEVTDAQARRVFLWDGERWLEHDQAGFAP